MVAILVCSALILCCCACVPHYRAYQGPAQPRKNVARVQLDLLSVGMCQAIDHEQPDFLKKAKAAEKRSLILSDYYAGWCQIDFLPGKHSFSLNSELSSEFTHLTQFTRFTHFVMDVPFEVEGGCNYRLNLDFDKESRQWAGQVLKK